MRLENIAGHCAPKRALEVAAAGHHSILLVGPRGAGKDSLLEALALLGPEGPEIPSHAVPACWCGASGDPGRECACPPKALTRYARRLRDLAAGFDLLIEVVPVPVRELQSSSKGRGTTEQAVSRIAAAAALQRGRGQVNGRMQSIERLCESLDDPGRRIMEMAVRRLSLGVGEVLRMLRVARTIADLAGQDRIPARALAEAVQYRALCR